MEMKLQQKYGSRKNVIYWGGGRQSTALIILLNSLGLVDLIINSKVPEPSSVVKFMDDFKKIYINPNGIEYLQVYKTGMFQDLKQSRFAMIPFFYRKDDGDVVMVKRQCTDEKKIRIGKKMLSFYMFDNKIKSVNVHFGIPIDELHRAKRIKELQPKYINPAFPLIDAGMNTNDCIDLIKNKTGLIPVNSRCVFCPFQSNHMWRQLIKTKNDFDLAVRYEKELNETNFIKNTYPNGAYLHRSCIPLKNVDFGLNQLNMFETENECGSGHCFT